jgi:hypothetical protein
VLILEITKGDVDGKQLESCQADARGGLYTEAMAGFLQWLAGDYEKARAAFTTKVSKSLREAAVKANHARTPQIAANLQAAFEMYVEYALAVGAITAVESVQFKAACWQAVCHAAIGQTKHQRETEPTVRYLDLLRSVLSSGRAHLEDRNGGIPSGSQAACGWRKDSSGQWVAHGDCVGWLAGDDLYIEPAAAFRVIQIAARDSGEAFAISEPTLKKRLREKGLLASIDFKSETLTIRRTICGSSKRVLHFQRATILPEEAEDQGEDIG